MEGSCAFWKVWWGSGLILCGLWIREEFSAYYLSRCLSKLYLKLCFGELCRILIWFLLYDILYSCANNQFHWSWVHMREIGTITTHHWGVTISHWCDKGIFLKIWIISKTVLGVLLPSIKTIISLWNQLLFSLAFRNIFSRIVHFLSEEMILSDSGVIDKKRS